MARHSISLFAVGTLLSALTARAEAPSDGFAPETEASRKHVAAAARLAGSDLEAPLFLCRPDSLRTVRGAHETGGKKWLEPTRVYDDLSFVGNEFVGVWVLETSAGLILFDATSTREEAEQQLVPGLRKLGLDPAQIKYVIVTHGHWDHFGGAAYLQQTFGARIGLSVADWELIEKLPEGSPEIHAQQRPKRDLVLSDGQKLTLGATTVTLSLTPGHTPGTVSALVPVHADKKPLVLSLFGSVAFPSNHEPNEKTGGLRKYDGSVQRFAELSRKAGARGILNTHVFADGGLAKLQAAQAGRGQPFTIGAEAVGRYYGVLHECLQAALARPETLVDWSKAGTPHATNPPVKSKTP
jgi:metallo-beta-lactamase class B